MSQRQLHLGEQMPTHLILPWLGAPLVVSLIVKSEEVIFCKKRSSSRWMARFSDITTIINLLIVSFLSLVNNFLSRLLNGQETRLFQAHN